MDFIQKSQETSNEVTKEKWTKYLLKAIDDLYSSDQRDNDYKILIKNVKPLSYWIKDPKIKEEISNIDLWRESFENFIAYRTQLEKVKQVDMQMKLIDSIIIQIFLEVNELTKTHKQMNMYFEEAILLCLCSKLKIFQIENDQELIVYLKYNEEVLKILKRTKMFGSEPIEGLEKSINYVLNHQKMKINDMVYMIKILFEDIEDDLTLNEGENGIKGKKLIHKIINNQLQTISNILNGDPNCDIHFNKIERLIEQNPKFFEKNIVERVKILIGDSKRKPLMDIQKDKPLIRIKQLTPRIEDSGDEDEDAEQKEMKKLKKSVKKTEKKAMKDLKLDTLTLKMQKEKERQVLEEKKTVNYKKMMNFMEEQQKEMKKIKTTQLQHQKRYKNKKQRMAGNKTAANAKNNVQDEQILTFSQGFFWFLK